MLSYRKSATGVLMASLVVATLLPFLASPRCALAAPLSPGAFTSLGTLALTPGTYTIDTTALTFTGPGPVSFTGVEAGGIAVFTFASITIPDGVVIKASGSRPLALLSQGDVTLGGVIDASGADSGPNFSGGGGAPGGPGGGSGGAANPNATQAPAGSGPGGGGGANHFAGAGGGGFGGVGARGATVGSRQGAAGGIAYGDLLSLLQGGSGGGGAWSTQGAGGGGGLEIGAAGGITISATGAIKADGGDASAAGQGAPGGGSGGAILLHADTLVSAGQIRADGGQGGRGSCCGAGGGGGGGRIALVAKSITNTGSVSAAGGTSGTGVNGNCAGGTCAFGTPSPDPTGAPGQILEVSSLVPLTDFRDVRGANNIALGPDLGRTGQEALNFTGTAGAGGNTWITVYDPAPPMTFGSVHLNADVLIHTYNNKKGAGLLALYNEASGKKGLALTLYDAGNTDTLDLATVDQAGKLVTLKTVALGAAIAENVWYRVSMDVTVSAGVVDVVGTVFRHQIPTDPDSALTTRVGQSLNFSGTLGVGLLAGVDASGEVGILAAAVSAANGSSVTNFTVDP